MKAVQHLLWISALISVTSISAEICVSTASLDGLNFDLAIKPHRVVLKDTELMPIASNNSAGWQSGGNQQQGAFTLFISEMSADGGSRSDPDTWNEVGIPVELASSNHEELINWEPNHQGLYSLKLIYGSGSEEVAFFDLTDMVFTRTPVTGLFFEVPSSLEYTGMLLTPPVTVRNGLDILLEGRDYSVEYFNNLHCGTGRIRIQGIGNYSGVRDVFFSIYYARVASSIIQFEGLDLREELILANVDELLPFAYNSSPNWLCGGTTDYIARISSAPKDSATGDTNELLRMTHLEQSGEGTKKIRMYGVRNYRIDFIRPNGEVVTTLSRDLYLPQPGLVILIR